MELPENTLEWRGRAPIVGRRLDRPYGQRGDEEVDLNAVLAELTRALRRSGRPGRRPRCAGTGGALEEAIAKRRSDVCVTGGGQVVKLLADDNEGSRHQRFLVRLAGGEAVLVAHNVDVGRRVEPLRVGDGVEFSGEFEWNDLGGVVHWTHHDPIGRHPDGWVKANGKMYN